MSYKKLSYIMFSLLIAVNMFLIFMASKIKLIGIKTAFVGGPKFYPMAICCGIIILSLIDIIITAKEGDHFISFPNLKYLFFTLAVIIIWVILWKYLIGFFPSTSIAVAVMLFYLNPEQNIKKKIISAIVIDAIIVLALYLIFNVIFFVNF